MRFVHGAWGAQHPWDHSRAGVGLWNPLPMLGLATGFVLPGSALLSFVSAGWIMSRNYQRWLADELFCSPSFSQHVPIFRACGVPGAGSSPRALPASRGRASSSVPPQAM